MLVPHRRKGYALSGTAEEMMKWPPVVSWAAWKKTVRFCPLMPDHWRSEAAGLHLLQLSSHIHRGKTHCRYEGIQSAESSGASICLLLSVCVEGWLGF